MTEPERPGSLHPLDAASSPVERNDPAVARRAGQVVVVSPFRFVAAFDCALALAVRETPHPAVRSLLPGRRPFHQIPADPPGRPYPRAAGLCRCCSGARTLARRASARPRVSRRGDFPQRLVVAEPSHRQLPTTSWHRQTGGRAEKPSPSPWAVQPLAPEGKDRNPGRGWSGGARSSSRW